MVCPEKQVYFFLDYDLVWQYNFITNNLSDSMNMYFEVSYCLDITFDSVKEIDLRITTGNLAGNVILGKKKIAQAVKNRNHTYSTY